MNKGVWKNKGKKSNQRRKEELRKLQRYSRNNSPTKKERQIQTNKKEVK